MINQARPKFTFPMFQPKDLEAITGLSPVAIRDWRRRKLLNPDLEKQDGAFHFSSVAEFLLLRRLSDHGIGPKQVFGWSTSASIHLMHHAVNDRSAWANDNAWALWCDREKRNPLERFFYLAPGIVSMTNDPLRVLEGHAPVATFVDLLQLGNELRAAILPRVADASITNWQYDDHGDSVVVTIDDDEGELVE